MIVDENNNWNPEISVDVIKTKKLKMKISKEKPFFGREKKGEEIK